jgi:hypothetical protein
MASKTETTADEFPISHAFVNGMPTPPFITQAQYDAVVKKGLRSTDVVIATYPKAGTTWAQQICRLIEGSSEEKTTDAAVPWLDTK